jgi:methylated-DNA-[protein]-cysteine S-methyltransferase
MNVYYDWIDTPLGPMLAVAHDEALVKLSFAENDGAPDVPPRLLEGARRSGAQLRAVRTQLLEYFDGERSRFELELAPLGSAYALRVWNALLQIPYGQTRSYGELARALASSARAVGRANATNPIAVVVPCHRVIGNDGTLTGYAGGLARKSALLALERGARAWTGQRPELELSA